MSSLCQLFSKLPKGPTIYATHGMLRFNERSAKNVTLTHNMFKRKKVILIVRDPKDTLVSLYFHNAYRTVPPGFTQNVESMIRDNIYGIKKYLVYYQAWAKSSEKFDDLLILRYEDTRKDPKLYLKKIANFIGLTDVSDQIISNVVEACQFSNMKKVEMENALPVIALNRSINPRPEAFKIRSGKVGGYTEHLSSETIEYINQQTREQLPRLYRYPIEDYLNGRDDNVSN